MVKCTNCKAELTNEEIRNIADVEGVTFGDIEYGIFVGELLCDKCADGQE